MKQTKYVEENVIPHQRSYLKYKILRHIQNALLIQTVEVKEQLGWVNKRIELLKLKEQLMEFVFTVLI